MFQTLDVESSWADQPEQIGTKEKLWFTKPDDERRWLIKFGRPNTGEDWAEKIASHLAAILGLPCARYELATFGGRRGVACPSFVPQDGRLVLGNEVLAKSVPEYDLAQRYQQRQHTLRTVLKIMQSGQIHPPINWDASTGMTSAAHVFVGYLLLDAWIGNTDRHHENWGFVSVPGDGTFLAPTFDHASSLGRELNDDQRLNRLQTRDIRYGVKAYTARGRSAFFKSPGEIKPLGLLEAFVAAARIEPEASGYWLNQLGQTKMKDIEGILSFCPNDWLSQTGRIFVLELLRVNSERLKE